MNTSFIIGNEGTLNISGPFDRDGYLIINIGDKKYVATLNGGITSVNISNLNVGQYNVTITYQENDKYLEKEFNNIATVEVDDKYPTPLNINNLTINVDDVANINVTGIPKALNGRNITITITGKASKNVIINNGTATATFKNLTKSNYEIVAEYTGDNIYKANTTNATLTINKFIPDVSAISTSFIVGNEGILNITGSSDCIGILNITIGDNKYTSILINGKATLNVSNLGIGEYGVDIIYLENDRYYERAFYNIATVTVTDKADTPLNVDDVFINVGDDAIIYVELPKDANGTVTATVNNKSYIVSLEDGKTNINISGLDSGNYTAIIAYSGNDKYESVTTNVTIEVSNNFEVFAPDVVKYYHGAERFNVYVLLNGKAVANKTVKITINGITYNKTTDTKGIASLAIRLSNGTYNVTTTVDNTTVKSNVTVLSTIIGLDLTKYYKNQTQYSVKVYDTKGKPVGKNEIVTFNVNGIFYNRTTDENGIATLNINLSPSDYIITADYKGCKISNKIKVLQVLNAEDIIMNYLDGTQFKANLIDGQGKPYKNQMITFNINGISYNRLTDSNGQAALNIRLPAGEYIITSSFNGANIANKITITG